MNNFKKTTAIFFVIAIQFSLNTSGSQAGSKIYKKQELLCEQRQILEKTQEFKKLIDGVKNQQKFLLLKKEMMLRCLQENEQNFSQNTKITEKNIYLRTLVTCLALQNVQLKKKNNIKLFSNEENIKLFSNEENIKLFSKEEYFQDFSLEDQISCIEDHNRILNVGLNRLVSFYRRILNENCNELILNNCYEQEIFSFKKQSLLCAYENNKCLQNLILYLGIQNAQLKAINNFSKQKAKIKEQEFQRYNISFYNKQNNIKEQGVPQVLNDDEEGYQIFDMGYAKENINKQQLLKVVQNKDEQEDYEIINMKAEKSKILNSGNKIKNQQVLEVLNDDKQEDYEIINMEDAKSKFKNNNVMIQEQQPQLPIQEDDYLNNIDLEQPLLQKEQQFSVKPNESFHFPKAQQEVVKKQGDSFFQKYFCCCFKLKQK